MQYIVSLVWGLVYGLYLYFYHSSIKILQLNKQELIEKWQDKCYFSINKVLYILSYNSV